MTSDFVVEIDHGDDGTTYEVVVDSPAGSARGQATLDAATLHDRRPELAATVLASAVPTRALTTPEERTMREVGSALYSAVFAGPIYGRYTASVQNAAQRGERLRILLRLRAPELASIPWETLFDPELDEYLCQRQPILRYVETSQPTAPLYVDPPLRVLALVASPSDLPQLDTAEEQRRLTDALSGLVERGRVELAWVEAGTWSAFQTSLQDGPWHVVHFVGHGGVSQARESGMLALEDEVTGRSTAVSASRFARLLHASVTAPPRLVVLNSCQSGEAAADDLLSSTAAALVASGVTAAVAMQSAISDPAAIAFSRGFYHAIATNAPIDEAVRQGRIAIDGTSERTLEWVTPVLYLRSEETRLFTVAPRADTAADESEGAGRSSDQEARDATAHQYYVQALAAMRNARYEEAVTLLDSVIVLDPAYRDATTRRDSARRSLRLDATYERALAAEREGDWSNAERLYVEIIDLDPQYRDAAARYDSSHHNLLVETLTDEITALLDARDSEATAAAVAELAELDPDAAARFTALERGARDDQQGAHVQQRAAPLPPSAAPSGGRRRGLVIAIVLLLVIAALAVAAVLLASSRGGEPGGGTNDSRPSTTGTPPASQPALSLDTFSGAAGSEVVATATGFRPGEEVQIRFDGILVTEAPADDNGQMTGAFTVPNDVAPDRFTVSATGRTSRRRGDAVFEVTA